MEATLNIIIASAMSITSVESHRTRTVSTKQTLRSDNDSPSHLHNPACQLAALGLTFSDHMAARCSIKSFSLARAINCRSVASRHKNVLEFKGC